MVEEYKKIPLRHNKFFWIVLALAIISLYSLSTYFSENGQFSSLQTSLQSTENGLNTCVTARDSYSSQLNDCSNNLNTANGNYNQCSIDLLSCNTSLSAYIAQSGNCASALSVCQNGLTNYTNLYTSCSADLSACNYNYNAIRTNFDILAQNYGHKYCCQANLFAGGHNYAYYYTTNNDVGCTDTATTYTKSTQC